MAPFLVLNMIWALWGVISSSGLAPVYQGLQEPLRLLFLTLVILS